MRLAGKTVVITGSSQGIGRAVATRLAAEGAALVVNHLNSPEAAESLRAELESKGSQVLVVQADVSRSSDCQRLIDEAVRTFGRIDVLINNAGVETRAPFWEASEEDYDRVMAVNLKGPFFVSRAFVRHVLHRHHVLPQANGYPHKPVDGIIGRIINISSVHEDLAFPNFAAYGASKGGLRMLARTLAVELGPYGITVNNIAPGAIRTDINQTLLNSPAKMQSLLAQTPLGRMGEGDDVAGVAAFLCSSDADFVTGSTYTIDGGLQVNYREQ